MNVTYTMEAHCRNCTEVWEVHIPKGVSVKTYALSHLCPNCACGDIYMSTPTTRIKNDNNTHKT